MKQKIGTLLYQQDNQANFMTQEIEKKWNAIRHSAVCPQLRRQEGRWPNIHKQLNYFGRKTRLIKMPLAPATNCLI